MRLNYKEMFEKTKRFLSKLNTTFVYVKKSKKCVLRNDELDIGTDFLFPRFRVLIIFFASVIFIVVTHAIHRRDAEVSFE